MTGQDVRTVAGVRYPHHLPPPRGIGVLAMAISYPPSLMKIGTVAGPRLLSHSLCEL